MPSKRRRSQKEKFNQSAIDEWDPDYLLTNPRSVLVHADLVELLSKPEVWALFDAEERKQIASHFPDHVPLNDDGFITPDWLQYDNDWRNGVRQWQIDLAAGHHDPEWQLQAAKAMEERAAGKYDNFKEDEFEAFWGQKQKFDSKMLAGQSAVVKLNDLISSDLFRTGDFWTYCRVFGRGNNRVEVVKDCEVSKTIHTCGVPTGSKLIQIVKVEKLTLTFAIPPEHLRYARTSHSSDLSDCREESHVESMATTNAILCTVSNAQALENKILELDGRVKKPPHHNAWKVFRCQRDNQDLGSLFEVREEYFVWKHLPQQASITK